VLSCFHCGASLPAPPPGGHVGRRDACPSCHRDLHACVQCANWDHATRVCREPAAAADQPRDRELANFCDWFRLGPRGTAAGGADAAARARSAADALFKPKR
jgi:hypothetical protein